MPVPPHLIIASELPCGGCNYDIRGQPLSGVCPECGRPIEQSLTSIAAAPEAYLRHLRRGLRLALAALALGPSLYVLSLVVGLVFVPGGQMFIVLIASLFVLGPIGSTIGWYRISLRQPNVLLLDARTVNVHAPPRVSALRALAVAFAALHSTYFLFVLGEALGGFRVSERLMLLTMVCALAAWLARNYVGLGLLGPLATCSYIPLAAGSARVSRWVSLAALASLGVLIVLALLAEPGPIYNFFVIASGATGLACLVASIGYAYVLVVMLRAVSRFLRVARARTGPIVAAQAIPDPLPASIQP